VVQKRIAFVLVCDLGAADMVRKKAKPMSRGNLDIDPDVAPVANEAPAEHQLIVLLSSDSSDESSVEGQCVIRACSARPQVKRGRNSGVGTAARPIVAARKAAIACGGTAANQAVVLIESSDSCSDDHFSLSSEKDSIVKQIWSFADLSFEHEDFALLRRHFNSSTFCIAFVVVEVHGHLLPAIHVDALGYSFGISCKTRPDISAMRSVGPNSLRFVLSSTSDALLQLSLKFDSDYSELSADTIACLGRGLLTFEHGIWSSESSRFIFPLVLNLDALSLAQPVVRKCLHRVLSEYRPQQFSELDEENSRPLPVDQILDLICRRPEEHVEPPAEFRTPENIAGVSTILKGYQQEVVAWARCVESGAVPPYCIRDLIALPVECSITQRELLFDPVLYQISAPVSDLEQFRVRGGMICDEMGLGKTLECLALVMLTRNPCRTNHIMPSVDLLAPQSQSPKPESLYRCVCGQNDVKNMDAVQCENCLYWLHSKCVESFNQDLPYFCLSCRTHVRSPLESDCTLIISPSSICGQVRIATICTYCTVCCMNRSNLSAVEG
jgi:hypothetical protein